jgi:cell pole-organizing protein PopZ
MTQAAKAQEPSMEEILASIRRIIADDEPKPAARPEAKAPEPPPPAAKAPPPPPPPKPAPAAPTAPAAMKQDDIDAMLAGLDEAPEPTRAPPKPEPAPAPEPEDVLELTEAMQAPAPAFRKIDGTQDVVFDEVEPEPPPRAAEPPRAATPPPPEHPILSPATAAAVDSAFNALAHTVLVQNAKTLEDLVKEMLRPMLQHWLDNNLPTLVERLVRQEIERVARGRG